jgi:hypothetical protein
MDPAPVQVDAWPCVIAEADFEQDTITLKMQCSDYEVRAGQHWLHTTKPAAQTAVPTVPMQPIVVAGGVTRFKANAIVIHLLQTHPTCDMNKLAGMDFTDEDRMQFAQLIGYSVGGYAELSYVSDESYEAAEKAAHGVTKGQK